MWTYAARNVWQVHAEKDGETLNMAMTHVKSSYSSLRPTIAYDLTIAEGSATFRRSQRINDTAISKLKLQDQIAHVLKDNGAMAVPVLAEMLGTGPNTIRAMLSRKKDMFVKVDHGWERGDLGAVVMKRNCCASYPQRCALTLCATHPHPPKGVCVEMLRMGNHQRNPQKVLRFDDDRPISLGTPACSLTETPGVVGGRLLCKL